MDEFLEIVSVALFIDNRKVLIMGTYRPPDGNISKLVDFLGSEVLNKISPSTDCFWLGDLNIDLLSDNSCTIDFINRCRNLN